MKRRSRITCRGFLLLEIVAAIGILTLIMAGVFAGIHLNETMLQHCLEQQAAIGVLDNVVERLAAAPDAISPDACRQALEHEMQFSPLGRKRHIAYHCRADTNGNLRCAIRDRNHLLAEVRIPIHES